MMGVDPFKYKRLALVVSAIFAVMAGGFRTYAGRSGRRADRASLSEALRPWGEIRRVLAAMVILIARAYPTGLSGLCAAGGRPSPTRHATCRSHSDAAPTE